MNLDAFLSQISWTKGGWYPIGPYFCMWLLLICHAMHVMTGAFSAWTPKGIHCINEGAYHRNGSNICFIDGDDSDDHNIHDNNTCSKWSFGEVEGKPDLTLVRDFNLVCDNSYITMLINTLYVAGVFFGNIFLGSLPDKFGRKNVCLFGNLMLGVTALVFAFSEDIYTILILRFIGGLFYSMTQFTVWMWVTELFSTKDRFLPVGMVYHGWSSGLVIISGIAYAVPSWRHLHLVVMAFCFCAIPLYFVLPESLYWLERNKKKRQSAEIMSAIKDRKLFVGIYGNNSLLCRQGAVDAIDTYDDDVENSLAENGFDSAYNKLQQNGGHYDQNGAVTNNNDIFANERALELKTASVPSLKAVEAAASSKAAEAGEPDRRRRRSRTLSVTSLTDSYAYGSKEEPKEPKLTKTYWICLVLCSSFWFIDGLLYYGLQFSTAEFAGDRFLNFFLFSVVEYPATILAFCLGKFTTRRFTLFFLHIACGVSMVLSAILRWTNALEGEGVDETVKDAIFNTLNITAKFFVTACFSVMCYVPAEVFPTNVRNTSFNINGSFSRLAAIMGTFMPLFFRFNPALAECIFGLTGIFAGLTAFLMPESKNRPLPQTMEDLEVMARRTGSIWKMKY